MRLRGTTRSQRRSGTILVWVALSLAVIFGVVALNMDGGRLMEERRRAQAAADAAALAAGNELYAGYWRHRGLDATGAARAAAERISAANGYPASAVTVHVPPQTGEFAGQAGHAEVVVCTALDASFGQVFTGQPLPVSARSVARGQPLKIGIIALRPSGADAFVNRAAAFALVNKPLIVNSDDPVAFRHTGLAFVASRVDVTGGASVGGLLSLVRLRTGVRPTLDPLAFLPVPDQSGPVRSAAPLTINSLLPTILQPGVYQGGIRATGVAVVTMLPGVYVMRGGGFQVEGAATVVGLETMVYNTTSPDHAAGPIRVASLGRVVMAAPLGGVYQGINFFQNRSLTQPVEVTGAGLTTITGTVYAARAPARLTGLAAAGLDILGGAYVVDSMTVEGVGAVTVDLRLNPPRVPEVRVVE